MFGGGWHQHHGIDLGMIEALIRDAVFAMATAAVFLALHLLVWKVLPRLLPEEQGPGPRPMLLAIWSSTVALGLIATIHFVPHGTDLQLGAILVMVTIAMVVWQARGSKAWRNVEPPPEKTKQDRDYEMASTIGLALGIAIALFVEL